MTDDEIRSASPAMLAGMHVNIRWRARRLGLAVPYLKAGPKRGYKQSALHIARRQWRTKTVAERFEALCIPVPESGCRPWLGTTNGKGYGRFVIDGSLVMPHRYAYEQRHGPIPQGLMIDHLCRVPCCVNPDHMEVVTSKENTRRGWEFRRRRG